MTHEHIQTAVMLMQLIVAIEVLLIMQDLNG